MSVASPCINVCTLDASGRICLGCYRTIEEIAAWAQLGDEAREAVLQRLAARRAMLASGGEDP